MLRNAHGFVPFSGPAACVVLNSHWIADFRKDNGPAVALHVLAYNLTRVMNIVGIKPLLAAIRV